jgi:tellurite resistance protein TehA-like permease
MRPDARNNVLGRAVRQAARGLSPAYFALVMATGIVSVEAHLLGMRRVASALFEFNVAAFAALVVLTVLRACWFARELWHDMMDHRKGPGFFTSVAAAAVLGSQCVVLEGDYRSAAALWVLALVLWAGLTYAMFSGFAVKERKPALDESISGTWLLAVVATQSIAVLTAYLTAHRTLPYEPALDFLALSLWLWGGMLYIWIIALIFYRSIFFQLLPLDFTAPYWISMGAMAISTLAGALLVDNARDAALLAPLAPFLEGFTVLCWATGTWWIPLLVVLMVWRHWYRRVPLQYGPLSWSAVFPLGMYAASSFQMAHALGLEFLYPILPYAGYVALAAWAIACVGLARALLHSLVAQVRTSGA